MIDCKTGQLALIARRCLLVALTVVSLVPQAARAGAPPTHYEDRSDQAGFGPHHPQTGSGTGVAAADYDGDGLVDLYVPQGDGFPNLLYHNLGHGRFEETGAEAGVGLLESTRSALWVDYDGDGRLDLWLANDRISSDSSFRLFRQGPVGTFTDVTVSSGVHKAPIVVAPTHHWGGLCAGDLNRDGYPELFAAQWPGPAHLFLNRGDGTFEDVGAEAGVAGSNWFAHQPMILDIDADGWFDIFQNIDFDPNLLWINRRDMTFVNRALQAGLASNYNEMGVTISDYDNDADLDIYVSNIFMPPPPLNQFGPRNNILFRNDSVGRLVQFTDVTEARGGADASFSWGVSMVDTGNRGWVDIVATNGWRSGTGVGDVTRFFTRPISPEDAFENMAQVTGLDDAYWGSAVVAIDVDRDGDQDLVQTTMDGPLRLLVNRAETMGGTRNYVVIRPRMPGPNRFAIGAVVRLTAGGVTQARLISAGTSYMGQEPAEAHFGIGEATSAQFTIDYPDGSRSPLTSALVNAVMTVMHGGPGDFNADGYVDHSDAQLLASCLTGPAPAGVEPEGACLPADLDGTRAVDLADVAVLQRRYTGDATGN